ncbi:MAG: outer membrane lipoprotein carrier protein LolA, partial [Bacilli bacterium]
MKKILILSMLALSLVLSGCGKNSADDALKNFTKKIATDSYKLEGKLELTNNEDTYNYDVIVAYQKDDKYRVSLKNVANNHEQVILRNKDGVYVLTPSLNKSFKFQSEWPANSSQIYLLQSIINDLKSDTSKTVFEKDKNFIYLIKANYPNNSNLTKQKVMLDKNGNIKT